MRRVLLGVRLLISLGIVLPILVVVLYLQVPHSNARLTRVDVLIVLGCPTMPDGSPTAEQTERVNEAVREFSRGVGNHLIFTGGAAHNRFVEAHAMAELASAGGVPQQAIIEETASSDSIQNIYFSNAIMQAHGWHTAEVISSPSHLARAALILGHYPELRWKTHSAEWPKEYAWEWRMQLYTREAIASFLMRIPGLWPTRYLPS